MNPKQNSINHDPMHQWATDLFPICRSITGNGVRETLTYLKNLIPDLEIHSIPSGTKVMDWTVPDEWNIEEAYIEDPDGSRIIDFKNHNLHIVNYSEATDAYMSLEELNKHLYSLPDMPEAIPYVTSYYKRRWGFCLTYNQRQTLSAGQYHVVIKSTIKPGELNHAELVIPGRSDQEIFFSTYVCHPSMGNNELSGPVLATAIARWIYNIPNRKYTYRFSFAPETIGAISYISKNIDHLKNKTIAAFNLTCVGDKGNFSFMPSRLGDTLSDRVALHVLRSEAPDFNHYSFLDRGSDERHYCSPGVDLPMVSILRTKYGLFPEYHTSLDNLEFISQKALEGTLEIYQKCIHILENNITWKATKLCEPQLSKRNLYPDINQNKEDYTDSRNTLNFLTYADGNHDLIALSERINLNADSCIILARTLLNAGLIKDNNVK